MQALALAPSPFAAIDNVADSYVHDDKFIAPGETLRAGGAWLKWYDIAASATPVPQRIHGMARDFIAWQSAAGDWDGQLGFAILHRCGADFYFLCVCTWRNENEVWETVYAKGAQDLDFRLFPLPGPHRGTYCVWELGAVLHEQQAWRRYLKSARDDAAKRDYLGDSFEGAV